MVIGGIALILSGMILGDIFAAFILHPNANRIGENLLAATRAVAAHDPRVAGAAFQNIGALLENRGTKVDAHSHVTSRSPSQQRNLWQSFFSLGPLCFPWECF